MYSNTAIVGELLKKIDKLLKIARTMKECVEHNKISTMASLNAEMIAVLSVILSRGEEVQLGLPNISLSVSCRNIMFSLENISKIPINLPQQIKQKVEFELIPLIEDFRYDFYFFTCIFGDKEKEKEHYSSEFTSMVSNHYIDDSMKKDQYKYEVSIGITAYNHLEYTKDCIEHVMKYMPSGLNYELILLNNGSTDGTQAYFESLNPTKILQLKENSWNVCSGTKARIVEGRYLLSISNDVLVMPNYLENLMTCMESDKKIAMIVPTTPGVGNRQCITDQNLTPEQGETFAKQNNISDAARWESRKILFNPIALYRSEAVLSSKGIGLWDRYFTSGSGGDNALSKRLIDAGYKLILAKDCYCYHFGKVTRREEASYGKGIGSKQFKERYAVK